MIELLQVAKSFGPVRAVGGVTARIAPGHPTGLLGPNGAGKSTLIRMICGYITPTSGQVLVCGQDTTNNPLAARAAIGYLPESAPLYPEMSVLGYLRFRAGLYSMPSGQRAGAIDSAMRTCMIDEVARRRIGTLSKGFRQRVGLAAAILHDPPVVILDEPTSGFDPTQQQQMRALVRDLAQRKVVLFSSHILPEVEQVCDRVLIMARGRVRADGSPGELLRAAMGHAPHRVGFAPETDIAAARAVLEAVTGVARVVDGARGLDVYGADSAADLREAIARAAARAGLLVVHLDRPAPTLEQVFASVIASSDEGGGTGASVSADAEVAA
jgi:ABC-2 type transport system ATP-binding protein